ncbi:cache domain-containing sensor histidine kinase [Paenibacillus eucommiae]|uniref:histidine kinase n=1 Tax=Paenibacillus eucommiae TaxID=1355755 RepID=A0ABS4IV47_9BACL|nr:sensor histidine kinase [Paenibacillus eucommiae]MBP1991467.1 sensor histidine kinase YesM [Paenibacillus eucommiae]
MQISLKRQLSLMFLFISILIMIVSSVLVYLQVLDILKSRSEQSTVQLFRHVERGITSFRNEAEQVSVSLLMEPIIREVLEQRGSKVDHLFLTLELRELFKQTMAKYTYFDSIYLFTEEGEMVGVTNSRGYSLTTTKNHPFYKTSIYRASASQYTQVHWYGGQRQADFMEDPQVTERALVPDLLTFARYVKVLNNEDRSGILVFNIKEKELASVYQDLSDSEEMRTYIVDQEGTIISALNKADLGQQGETINSEGDAYGSFSQWGEKPQQVVYYRLPSNNWMLIKEIPMVLFNKDVMKLQQILLIVFVISLLLIVFLTLYWTNLILYPLKELAEKMQSLERGKLGVLIQRFPANEIGLLGRHFNRMSLSIAELIEQNEKTEGKKRQSEVKALQAQITPHFLHNTLNSIKWMAIVSNSRNIADSITTLGKMLHLFYKDTSLFCSVKDEIEYIVHYVKMMNMRYGEGIKLQIECPESLQGASMLKLILQPIVENAFLHGFEQKHYKGLIQISVHDEGGHLMIQVTDDGSGMTEERLEQIRSNMNAVSSELTPVNSIGISNTHTRIQLHYGSEYGLTLQSEHGTGTVATLHIPKIVL